MQFAALCTIENYANGLGVEVLTYEHIVSVSREHRHRTEEIVKTIIEHME
jgi:5'-methylthioadenosine phosphorylase